MFNTSESTASRRRGSVALKLGALVAASSLMLAGGVAVATSVYAAPGDNGNSQGKKPDKEGGNNAQNNGNENAPGQNDNNGGAVGGDNGGQGSNGSENGQSDNGLNADGGQGTYSVTICHATRSYSNPYVVITVDASSISELLDDLKRGNGHGDHVGAVFDPKTNVSGNNWGDIIPAITNPRTGETVFDGINAGSADWIGRGCKPPASVDVTVYWTYCVDEAQVVPAVSATAATEAEAITAINAKLPAGNQYGSDGGSADPDAVLNCGGGGGDPEFETATAPGVGVVWCPVVGGQYVGKQLAEVPAPASVKVAKGKGAQATTVLEAGVEAALLSAVGAAQNSQPDSIIPPVTYQGRTIYAGHNWKGDFINRYEAGCSPNQRVLAAISAPAAGTAPTKKPAGGNPQPGTVQVPAAGAPLPGSVPAGDGSSLPGLPVWALALLAVGAIGAAASGTSLVTSRKG